MGLEGTVMPSANPLYDRKRWFDRPDTLMRAGLSTLASTFLIVLAPQVGTILLEIFVGFLLVFRAFVLRARSRRAGQLCLEFRGRSGLAAGLPGSRIRFLDRYELLLIIAVILSYGSVSGFLRARRLPEGLVRILPLVTFGIGLFAKPRMLRWFASRKKAVVDGARQANAGVSQG
jgi:hypothetical protein